MRDERGLETQLITFIREGDAICIKIREQIGQQAILSLGKLAAYFLLSDDDWDTLQDITDSITKLNLPKPIQDVYINYVRWNRSCDDLFRKCRWKSDDRVKDFGKLRRDFGEKISKRNPDLKFLEALITDQVAILKSLLNEPPKTVERAKKTIPKKKGWSTRKVIGVGTYITACIILDSILFLMIGWGIIGLVGVEAAFLFGFPKLIEWLKK